MFPLLLTIGGYLAFGPLGGIIGSLVGALLFKEKKPSQKIEDIQYQGDSYGDPIHQVWGTMRVAGTVVWPPDLKLTSHVIEGEETGFLFVTKKTSPDRVIRKATWFVQLCEGPIDVIDKIWLNGELIFDVTDEATTSFRNQSNAFLTAPSHGIRFVYGTESQDPLSLMTDVHPDGYPQIAYRGRAGILFYDFNLEQWGNNLPQVNARVVSYGRMHPDHWSDATVEASSRINFCSAVVNNKIWIISGMEWDDVSSFDITGSTSIISQNDEYGTLEITEGPSMTLANLEPRQDASAVYRPGMMLADGSFGRLFVFGGATSGGMSYYADPKEGDMCCEFVRPDQDDPGVSAWTETPIYGDNGGITQGRIPFPRDSHLCVMYDPPNIGYHPYNRQIFLFGGRNTNGSHQLGWEGDGSCFRDMWMFSGGTWQLLTPIIPGDPDVSQDAGMGYRLYPTGCMHGEYLYVGGGLQQVGANVINKRDVYQLYISNPDDPWPILQVVNADILSGYGWSGDTTWFIHRLMSYRGRLVAFVTDDNDTACYMFASDDNGKTWEYFSGYMGDGVNSWDIDSSGNQYYVVAGDQRDYVTDEDSLANIDHPNIFSYKVTSVSYNEGTDKTTINVTGVVELPVNGTGTLHVDLFSKENLESGDYYNLEFEAWTGLGLIPNNTCIEQINGGIVIYGSNAVGNREALRTYWSIPGVSDPYEVPVRTVFEDICRMSGIPDNFIDGRDLTDTLHGVVFDPSSGKDRIDVLRQYSFFDVIMKDGKVTAITRGKDPIATLGTTDLQAYVSKDGQPVGNDIPDQVLIDRTEQKKLPISMEIQFYDTDADYQNGTQIFERYDLPDSASRQSVELPIAMDANKASQIAEVLLYDAMFDNVTIYTTREHGMLLPAAVISVTSDNESLNVRLSRITHSKDAEEDSHGILILEGKVEDGTIYDALQDGASRNYESKLSKAYIECTGIFLDIPILRYPEDDTVGFYWGAYPTNAETYAEDYDDFVGGRLFFQNLVDSSFRHIATTYGSARVFDCESVLGGGVQELYLDSLNFVVVKSWGASLEEVTSAEMYDAQANLAAIGSEENGWEIIQFQTPTPCQWSPPDGDPSIELKTTNVYGYLDDGNLVYTFADTDPPGKYFIASIIRGLYGTEHMINNHVAGEKIVLLDFDTLYFVQGTIDSLNVEVPFVSTHYGDTVGNYSYHLWENAGIGLKPVSPLFVMGEFMGNGDFKIYWEKRARGMSGAWASIPEYAARYTSLTETEEIYEIDIYASKTSDVVIHTQEIHVVSLDRQGGTSEEANYPYFFLPAEGYDVTYADGRVEHQYGQDDLFGGTQTSFKYTVYQISAIVGRGYGKTGTAQLVV